MVMVLLLSFLTPVNYNNVVKSPNTRKWCSDYVFFVVNSIVVLMVVNLLLKIGIIYNVYNIRDQVKKSLQKSFWCWDGFWRWMRIQSSNKWLC